MRSSTRFPTGAIPPVSSPAAAAVTIENPLASADWDARMRALPGFSFFHTAAWARVLHHTYGFVPAYFVASHDVEPVSVLPLMEVNSWLTGRRGVSLPFTDCCQLPGASAVSHQSLAEEALRYGRARHWKYVEWRAGSACCPLLADAPPSLSFFTHRLALSADAGSLFNRFDAPVRRAIRKSEKSGLKVEFSRTEAAIRDYYTLHCKTRRQHGLPPQPLEFFLNVHRHVVSQDMGTVVSARLGDRIAASAIFFLRDAEAIYKFGSSEPLMHDLRPNNLVMWEAIQRFARDGMEALDFGRTSLANAGLRRYKLGWGAEERPIRYYRYDLRRDAFVTEKDATVGWHVRLFRALPLFLARLAGGALYRHVG